MFQRTILIVAVVILILSLLVISHFLYRRQYSVKFPPEIGNCPDYYTAKSKDVCKNSVGLKVINPNCDTGDFSGSSYKGDQGFKRKCLWAKECGVTWDGISNRNPPLC